MSKSLPVLCASLAIAAALSGCTGPVTNRRAQTIALHALEDKYGGAFVVKSARSDIDVNTSSASLDYELEVYSREKRLTTHVTVSSDGKRVGDDLEELMYADQVEAEIHTLPVNASGWVLDKLRPVYHSYKSGQQGSASFEDYKRDGEKMELDIDAIVDGADLKPSEVKATAASLFGYADALQEMGYRIRLFIDCNGLLERLDAVEGEDRIDQKRIEETLKGMGAGVVRKKGGEAAGGAEATGGAAAQGGAETTTTIGTAAGSGAAAKSDAADKSGTAAKGGATSEGSVGSQGAAGAKGVNVTSKR